VNNGGVSGHHERNVKMTKSGLALFAYVQFSYVRLSNAHFLALADVKLLTYEDASEYSILLRQTRKVDGLLFSLFLLKSFLFQFEQHVSLQPSSLRVSV
jgi:hypothetical protein